MGPIEYSVDDLGALTSGQRDRLALLTALALAVADERVDDLIDPLVERDRQALLRHRLMLEDAATISGLSEEELRAAYLREPERELSVRHLVVLAERWRAEAERETARRRAADALDRIRAGEDFARVAGEVSEEPGAEEDGGLLPPGRRGTWVPEFWNAASALREGEVSGVVESPYGFHVLQLLESDTVPFDSVRHEALPGILEVVAAIPRARARLEDEPEDVSARRAEAMGIEVDRTEIEEFRTAWRQRVSGLATVFGFTADADEEQVKGAAMRALGDPRQSVRIAETELDEIASALESLYPRRAAEPDSGS